ncbi:MAG: glycosyltransferase [Dehalococcoidia bacterium]|nr:glycosyltransferase [Dehalococcoidia bacterium]
MNHHDGHGPATPDAPLLSVIATSYTLDRLGDVFDLMDSLKAQRYAPLETLFVAEGSRELYERVAAHLAEHDITNCRVLFNSGEPGLSAARNLGIAAAGGEILAFLDDDTVAFPDWAEEVVRACREDSVIGLTGATLPLWDDGDMSWLPKEFYWLISCTGWTGLEETTEVRNAWGHNMAFRRESFRACGGFDNRHGFHRGGFAEDNEFSLRVRAATGKRIVFSPRARVWHKVHRYRLSWRWVAARSYFIGRSRRMLQRAAGAAAPLAAERTLLRRILTRLLPRTLADLPRRPRLAGRRIALISASLTFLALGYLSGVLAGVFGKEK